MGVKISSKIQWSALDIEKFARSVVDDLTALAAAVNELIADRATQDTAMGEVDTLIEEIAADIDVMKAATIGDGIINATTLAIGTTPENISSTAFQYKIDGVTYAKAAVAAGTAFTAADTINTGAAAGLFWGIWAVQINAAGTITTKSPGADQVYTTEALAIAALPAADAGNVVIGYVTVQSKTGVDWVAITDDLTPASDCQTANYYNTVSSVPAALGSDVTPADKPATMTATTITLGTSKQ